MSVRVQASRRGRLWADMATVTGELFAGSPFAAAALVVVLVVGNSAGALMAAAMGGFVDAAVRAGGGDTARGAGAAARATAHTAHGVAFWLGVYVAATLIEQFYWNFKNLAVGTVRDHGLHRLQARILRRAAAVPLRRFQEGDFFDALQRASSGLGRLNDLIYTVADLGQLLVATISVAAVLGLIDPWLIPLLVAGTLPAVWLQSRVGAAVYAAERAHTRDDRVRGHLQGLLTGREAAAEIRLFGSANLLVGRWRDLRAARTRDVLAAEGRTAAAATLGSLVSGLAYVGGLLLTAWAILHGHLTVGNYVTVAAAALGFEGRLSAFIGVLRGSDEHAQFLSDLLAFLQWVRAEEAAAPADAAEATRDGAAARGRRRRRNIPRAPVEADFRARATITPQAPAATVQPGGLAGEPAAGAGGAALPEGDVAVATATRPGGAVAVAGTAQPAAAVGSERATPPENAAGTEGVTAPAAVPEAPVPPERPAKAAWAGGGPAWPAVTALSRGGAPAHGLAVSASGLVFAYPGAERTALRGVDVRIAPGERVAIVGENGVGKSTLAKVLMGLYAPDAGTVLLDGRPPAAARARVAAVFQDYAAYEFTLRENVAFGELARLGDDVAIRAALERADLGGIADRVPGGLDGYLGRAFGETDLSGGQWQRVALARAFFRDADLLVLDEPTAALDPLAELALFERFADLTTGRTAIMISHRLGAARLADRILVLQDGRIVEEGPHEALVDRGGVYARLFAAQAQWYRTEAGDGA